MVTSQASVGGYEKPHSVKTDAGIVSLIGRLVGVNLATIDSPQIDRGRCWSTAKIGLTFAAGLGELQVHTQSRALQMLSKRKPLRAVHFSPRELCVQPFAGALFLHTPMSDAGPHCEDYRILEWTTCAQNPVLRPNVPKDATERTPQTHLSAFRPRIQVIHWP